MWVIGNGQIYLEGHSLQNEASSYDVFGESLKNCFNQVRGLKNFKCKKRVFEKPNTFKIIEFFLILLSKQATDYLDLHAFCQFYFYQCNEDSY